MVVLAIGLSLATNVLDQAIEYQPTRLVWLYAGGAEGTRTLLSTIAGSMITIAGVTFSITIVALTLAASQFGPRLLANFMRDRGNQIVLGTFIATFTYCLLVLRTVRDVADNTFVPHISATFAVLLAMASMGVLIYFIHHVATSIQANHVIAAVGRELDEAITRLFPETMSSGYLDLELKHEDDIPTDLEQEGRPIPADQSGYLQAIDYDGLKKIAIENDLVLRLEHRPGDFVTRGSELITIIRCGESLEEKKVVEQINSAFIIGVQPDPLQDVEFAINQLVQIAVRALSPGINDPFTAMACIDRLGASLVYLSERSIPSGYFYDDENKLRLITDAVTFAGITEAAFNQIRQYGRSSVAVTVHLLETIAVIAAHTENEAYRTTLLRQAVMIKRGSEEAVLEEGDRKAIERRYEFVRQALDKHQVV